MGKRDRPCAQGATPGVRSVWVSRPICDKGSAEGTGCQTAKSRASIGTCGQAGCFVLLCWP